MPDDHDTARVFSPARDFNLRFVIEKVLRQSHISNRP